MKHEVIVPSLHLKHDKSNINSELMLHKHNIDIPIETCEWKKNTNDERMGCVNSFGFGGSNCHAIILQKSTFHTLHTAIDTLSKDSLVFEFICLSAPSPANLDMVLSRFKQDLSESREQLSCIAYTSTRGRTHYKHRLCFVANNSNDLRQQVSDVSAENRHNHMDTNIVFVYCGVGTSWTGMCSTLMKTDNHFRVAVEKVDRYLIPLAQFSIAEKFKDPKTEYSEPFLNHIAIFTAQVGLAYMWRSLGVIPDVILGQSVGEVAAAYASGSLSLKTAVDVIFHRSRVLANITHGSMMVVKNIDVQEVEKLCERFAQRVSVAVYSSPVACTVSGDAEVLEKMKMQLKALTKGKGNDIQIIDLEVSCAYHSHLVDPCMTEMIDRLKHVKPQTRCTPIISTVTGNFASGDEFQTGDYWAQNCRQAVRLIQAIKASVKSSSRNIFLEIGPKQILAAHFRDIFTQDQFYCYPSMRYRKEIQAKSLTIRHLYEHGLDINWESIYPKKKVSASIPRHAFSSVKTLYIPEVEKGRFNGLSDMETIEHSFLRRSVSRAAHIYIMISQRTTPYVFEHAFAEKVLVPGAIYVESALAISRRVLNLLTNQVELSVEFQSPIYPVSGIDLSIDCAVNKMETGLSIVFSKDRRVSCTANTCRRQSSRKRCIDTEAIKYRCCQFMTQQEIYDRLADYKLEYGPSLKFIQRSWSSDSECLAEIVLSETLMEETNTLQTHPAVVDAVFQLFSVLKSTLGKQKRYFLPKGIGSFVQRQILEQKMRCYMVQIGSTNGHIYFNALLLTFDGVTVCEMKNLHYQELREDTEGQTQLEFRLDWRLLKDQDDSTVEQIRDLQKKKALLFGTERTEQIFQTKYKSLDTLYIPLNFLSGHTKPDLKQKLEKLELSGMLAVLYAPMTNNSHTLSDNMTLYRTVKNNFSCLSKLLIAMNELSLKLPVYVVTENTQDILTQTPGQLSVIGSELWGMVRCVQYELLVSKIYLIDINRHDRDENALYKILLGYYGNEDEFAIKGASVYVNKFNAQLQESETASFRFKRLENEDFGYFKSASPFSLKKPVFEYHERKSEIKNEMSKHCCVRLSSICVHKRELYTTCSDIADIRLEVWPELRKDGFQVVAVEGEGIVANDDHMEDTMRRSQHVCFLLPVDAATYVNVPTELIVNKCDIPHYMPGMLIVGNVIFSIFLRVSERQSVCILAERADTFAEMFLTHLLQYCKNCSVSTLIPTTCTPREETRHSCIIITSKVDIGTIKEILDTFPNLEHIVTISEFMPKSVSRCIRHNYPNLHLSIIAPETLFEQNNYQTRFNEFRKHLTEFCQKTSDFYERKAVNNENSQLLSLPFKRLFIYTDDGKQEIPLRVGKSHLFRKKCCYIVIGGLTGLGWQVLKYIADMGGGYIVTMNRREVSDSKRNELNKIMSDRDVCIICIQVDITDLKSLRIAFAQLQEKLKGIGIKGIFNGAGVLADSLLVHMSEQEIDKAMKPKVLGSWNLHLVSKDLDLDYFVLHSSIVSVLGNAGQSNYGAGGSFVDALACYRRSQGLCAQSINWGALSVGMAEENNVKLHLLKSGIGSLSISETVTLLTKAVLLDEVQFICGRFDLSVMGKRLNVSKLQEGSHDGHLNKVVNETVSVEKMLDFSVYLNSDEADKHDILVKFVQIMICQAVPGLVEENLSAETKTAQYFVDSLEAVVFTNQIRDFTKCRLDVQLLYYEETTISGIADYLLQHIGVEDKIPTELTAVDPVLAVDTKVSFMEKSVLFDYFRNTKNPALNRIIDIEINRMEFDIELWQSAIHRVVTNNKELCKLYILKDIEFDAKYLSEEEIYVHFQVIPFESVGNCDIRNEISFDLTNEIPIKFQIAHKDGCIILRLLLHAVVTDLASVTIICKDLSDTLNAMLRGEQLPTRKAVRDVVRAIHTKVNGKYSDLQRFWKSYLEILTQPATLVLRHTCTIPSNFSRFVKGNFPKDLVAETFEYTKKKGFTLFQFFTSVYQLYLHRQTTCSVVPVISTVDMRIHAPELKNYVARCLNNLLLIAVFKDQQVVEEFMTENSYNISSAVEHSAYPYPLIAKELLSESILQQAGRHRIIMDNMTEIDKVVQHKNASIKVRNMWHTRDEYESSWYIYYNSNTKQISYELGFNAAILDEDGGTKMRDELMALIRECLDNPSQKCTPQTITLPSVNADTEFDVSQCKSDRYTEQKCDNSVTVIQANVENHIKLDKTKSRVQHLSSEQKEGQQISLIPNVSVRGGLSNSEQKKHKEKIIKSGETYMYSL